MRLVWHQCCKDFWLFRTVLICWWLVLAVDLVVNLVVPGWITFDVRSGFSQGPAFVWGWVLMALWAGALLIPVAVVLVDSPLRENAFVRTRPISRKVIVRGKLLFIGLALFLPACLGEALHVLLAGYGFSWVIHATVERAIYLGVLMLAAAALGGVARSRNELTLGLVVMAVGAWLVFLGVHLFVWLLSTRGVTWAWVDDPSASRLLVWSALLGLGWFLAAWRNWRRIDRSLVRWMGFLAVVVLATLAALLPAWKLFPIRPTAPERAKALAAGGSLSLDWRSVAFGWHRSGAGDRPALQASVYPRLRGAADDLTMSWGTRSAWLRTENGQAMTLERGQRPAEVYGWRGSVTEQDLRAFETHLGERVMFVAEHGPFRRVASVSLGQLDADVRGGLTNVVTIEAELEGKAFRWVKAAQLPVKVGAESQDEAGSWSLVGVGRESGNNMVLGLRRDQIALRSARAAEYRRYLYWPGSLYEFVVVNRESAVAITQRFPAMTSLSLGAHTGVAHLFTQLRVQVPNLLDRSWEESSLDSLELWVFRREYLGPLQVTATSSQLDLALFQPPGEEGNGMQGTGSTKAELYRRLDAIPLPESGCSRVRAGLYLAEVLQIVEAGRVNLSADDPIVMRLVTLVPDHLDLFLTGMTQASHYSRRLLEQAVRRGTPESKSHVVLSALGRDPELARLVLDRGWEVEAQPYLGVYRQAPNALPLGAIQLLAAAGHRANYPRLLAELEQRPAVSTYEVLRTLDGIEPDLRAALDRIWQNRKRLLELDSGSLATEAMLLRAGHREALDRLLTVFHSVPVEKRERLWMLLDACREGILFEGIDHANRYDHAALAAWLTDRQIEDFIWDPNRRRFRLRTASELAAQL